MEALRLWLGPVVTSLTIVVGGIGSYYSVQARIFQEIESVGSKSRLMVVDMKADAVATQGALRETLTRLDMTVGALNTAVGELKADLRESRKTLDAVRSDVVRLQAQTDNGSQRRR